MPELFRRFLYYSSRATAIEYGLIAGLISVVIITALTISPEILTAKVAAGLFTSSSLKSSGRSI